MQTCELEAVFLQQKMQKRDSTCGALSENWQAKHTLPQSEALN